MGWPSPTAYIAAAATFAETARMARRGTVSPAEEAVFRHYNSAPDFLEVPIWAVMQSGSLAAAFVAAGGVQRRRGNADAAMVLATGTAVWAGIKAIKPAIGRGRPDRHLADVVVRGKPQTGLGFPSGHAAVSMSLALTATAGGPSRAVALAAALATGAGRMYMGAHLPLDVVGGFAAGTMAAAVARALG